MQGVELLVYVEGAEDAGDPAEGQDTAVVGGGAAASGADAAPAGRAAADPYSPSFSFQPPPSFRQTGQPWSALGMAATQ